MTQGLPRDSFEVDGLKIHGGRPKKGGESKTNSEWDDYVKFSAWRSRVKNRYVWTSLPGPCTASFQAFSVNAFRWRIRDERLGDSSKSFSDHVTRNAYWSLGTRQWTGEKRYVRTCGCGFFSWKRKTMRSPKKEYMWKRSLKFNRPPFACLSMLPAFTGTARYGPLWSGGLWNDLKLELHHPASSCQLYSANFISK